MDQRSELCHAFRAKVQVPPKINFSKFRFARYKCISPAKPENMAKRDGGLHTTYTRQGERVGT